MPSPTPHDDLLFGEIRSLLHGPAARAPWEQLRELLPLAAPDAFTHTLLPYMVDVLEQGSWQAVNRGVPSDWLDAFIQGIETPWIRLCNTLYLGKSWRTRELLAAWRAQPWLFDGLRSITLSDPFVEGELEAMLSANPRFRLHHLTLAGTELSDASLARLFDAPITRGLITLHSHCNPFGPLASQALSERPHFDRLTHLKLQGAGLTVDTLEPMLSSPRCASWQTLDLSGWVPHLSYDTPTQLRQNHARDEMLRLIAESPHLRSLQSLTINHNTLTNAALAHLARAEHLGSLRSLSLRNNYGITDAAVALLADAPHLQELEHLDLSGCSLTHESARLLDDARVLPRLRSLGISQNHLYIGEDIWYDWDGTELGAGPHRATLEEIARVFFPNRHASLKLT